MPKYSAGHPGRAPLAFLFSLVLHALLVGGWLGLSPVRSLPGEGDISSEVDAPSDRDEFTIVMRDHEPTPRVPPTPVRPKNLPETIDFQQSPWGTLPASPVPEIIPASVPATTPGPDRDPGIAKTGGRPLHGKPRSGQMIAYVLDCSSSMGTDAQLRSACRVLRASLDQLQPECRFQIVAYNSVARSLANQPLPATPENRTRAVEWIERLTAEGGSVHLAGLREVLWQQPDVVYLLTDEDDLTGKESQGIQRMLRKGVVLHAVIFNSQPGPEQSALRKICEASGGRVEYR